MPAGILKAVAEAVRADLETAVAANVFELQFTPERSHGDWELDLKDDDLHVDVVPVKTPVRSEIETRRPSLAYKVRVDVAVRKRMGLSESDPSTGRVSVEEVDVLDLLTQQIHQHFVSSRLSDTDQTPWDPEEEAEIRTSGPGGTLREKRQYISIVRLPFLVSVDL